ncbi:MULTISPECIES: hypothetical protein [unclassified Lysobacter]|uniref:hypothetical protein n=1 Tax=unclassified Lysobacter TaxID=2635362 RepID=UPI001BEA7584|nr:MULTISPECIES: hypothetical protein [unclassified Lysobacter]MBT2746066.1 hypothetical protein [Lysobacter sp. ISL-42]MBT2752501.1 hypothetical protein [Lysobacter sp. ISL-50]MBT2776770.1 hypothetical protein [Lysobacter sp. ISL-54]MBT2780662.1 hypothetical protein [Lysobacter sp. ISL-52]
MDAVTNPRLPNARFVRYLKPGDKPELATVQRIADELRVPIAYLFTDSDLLAQMVLAFGLLSEGQQRKALAQIKQQIFLVRSSHT